MKEKIYSIELFRFIFMVIICLWHYRGVVPVCNHGYLAVEFYFILSGFLLYYSYIGGKYKDALDYTIKKVRRFYLPFILMLPICLMICYRTWINKNFLDAINYILVESLMLHDSPMFSVCSLNLPTWYITTLLCSGLLVFYLLQKKTGLALLPLSMVGYGWLLTKYGTLDLVLSENAGILLLIRGLCGLSLGVGMAILKERISLSSTSLRIVDIAAFYALLAFGCMCFTSSQIPENEAILLAVIIIFACFQSKSLINKIFDFTCFAAWGSLSFYMLLVHYPICRAIEFVLRSTGNTGSLSSDYLLLAFIYLVIVLVCSFSLRWLERFIRTWHVNVCKYK